MNPLLLLAGAWLLWRCSGDDRRRNPRARRNPPRRVLPNLMAYTDAKGRIRPIRASDDYDPDVDEIERERRRLAAQAERYHGIRRERLGRLSGGVDRPPWAAGFTDSQLERIARDHGVRASREGWWEAAHLTSGSGELRRLLRESGYRSERTHKGGSASHAARGGRRPAVSRQRAAAIARASATGQGKDLPF